MRREQEAELEPQLAPIVGVADIGGMAPIAGQPLRNHRESRAVGENLSHSSKSGASSSCGFSPPTRSCVDLRISARRVGQEVARHPRVERVEVTGLIHRGGIEAVDVAAIGVDLDIQVPTTSRSGRASMSATCRSSFSGMYRSSASTVPRYFPRQCAYAML